MAPYYSFGVMSSEAPGTQLVLKCFFFLIFHYTVKVFSFAKRAASIHRLFILSAFGRVLKQVPGVCWSSLRRTLQCCSAAKLQECSMDDKNFNRLPSTNGSADNEQIHIFWAVLSCENCTLGEHYLPNVKKADIEVFPFGLMGIKLPICPMAVFLSLSHY